VMVMLNEPFPQKFPKALSRITKCRARKEAKCLVEFGTSKPDARAGWARGHGNPVRPDPHQRSPAPSTSAHKARLLRRTRGPVAKLRRRLANTGLRAVQPSQKHLNMEAIHKRVSVLEDRDLGDL
jgi:hypothetical protein